MGLMLTPGCVDYMEVPRAQGSRAVQPEARQALRSLTKGEDKVSRNGMHPVYRASEMQILAILSEVAFQD